MSCFKRMKLMQHKLKKDLKKILIILLIQLKIYISVLALKNETLTF